MHKLVMTGFAALALLATPALAQTAQTPPAPAKTPPPVAAPMAPAAKPAAPAPAMKPAAAPAAAPAAKAGAMQLLDINTATKAQLEALKGVGPVRADAIIKGRPYKGKDDLVQKKILPQNVYDDVKANIVARQH